VLKHALTSRSGGWLAVAATILAASAAPASAAERDKYSGAPLPPQNKRQVPSPITDRFAVRGSFFDSAVTTTLRVDNRATIVPGTTVSGERDLGLRGRVYQGRVEMYIRMRERNRLRVDYFESDRSATHQLSKQVNFADQTFNVNDIATTALDLRMFGLTYTYSVFKRERFELGAGLGIYLLQGDARGQVHARELSQEVSGVAPFPTLALDGTWRISSRFSFVARGQYLSDTVGDFSGSLGDYHADLQYRWRPNFSIGAGYSQLRLSLEVQGGSFPGLVALNVRGPEVFFRVSY
jgi:hypothetical protein